MNGIRLTWPGLRPLGLIALMAAALLAVPARAAEATVDATVDVLHAMTEHEGAVVEGPLRSGDDGWFYGTTRRGGRHQAGTAFRVSTDGQFEVLRHFWAIDGFERGGLVRGPDGYFYGLARSGGMYGLGTAFRLDSTGRFKLLHTFQGQFDGITPMGTLLLASDGHFYGVTANGGSFWDGTVFRMHLNGQIEHVHSFDGFDGGTAPGSRLIEGSDSLLYGTALGGRYGYGIVFKLHRHGGLRVLRDFRPNGREGMHPSTGLTAGPDGLFYGVAPGKHSSRRGLVYRIDSQGHLEIVTDFPHPGQSGREPEHELLLGRDGLLYGTTPQGGSQDRGTIFQLATDGTLTALHAFSKEGPEGYGPNNTLVEAADGEFLGGTNAGGEHHNGTIYRLRVPPLRFKLDPR